MYVSASNLLVLIFVSLTCGNIVTRTKLIHDIPLKAGVPTRIPYDSDVFDSEHNYHMDTRTIEITRHGRFRIEGHATFSGDGGHTATVKIQDTRNGKSNTLAECHTFDADVKNDRCKMLVTTELDDGDSIFVEVTVDRDATVTTLDTYLFISQNN